MSAALRLADEDSRGIIREELDTNLLVEAGAGSGKTQMLAERMAAGVANGVYEIEHMAAVTFTRKAASELRGRFHSALEAIYRELRSDVAQAVSPASPVASGSSPASPVAPGSSPALPVAQGSSPASPVAQAFRPASPVAQAFRPASPVAQAFRPASPVAQGFGPADVPAAVARIEHALGNLERFFAGTIHSFCARLLRERPVESGVSPGFTELDEVQDEEVRNRAWRDFITSARAVGDPEMLALLDTGVRPQDLDDAFATICLNEDVYFPPGVAVCPDPKPAWKALEKFWSAIQKELPEPIADETTCKIQQAARKFQAQLRVMRRKLANPAVVAELLSTWKVESKIVQKQWADTLAEKKRLRDTIQPLHEAFCADTVAPYLSAWRQYIYKLSVTLLTRASRYAADERRRRDALNYGDLLNLTAKVLRENAEVRRALQRKYRYLFVDEFQDTDPVQAEIVFLLAAEEASGSRRPAPGGTRPDTRGADWRLVPLRRGSLFVVGDPKQSIYRFRRADIEIYNTVRARFSDPSVGRVVTLTTNFRSVPELCEWANGVFQAAFPPEPAPHSPQFARLDPDTRRRDAGGVFTLTYAGDAKAVPAEDAGRIARYIRSEVDAGRRKYSDFLILTRRKKARIEPYASALEALNIPLEVSGAGAFGQSVEVQTLTTLLRAVADPLDPLPLINLLRGPLFGISDPELFAYRQSGGRFWIFDNAPVAQAFRPGSGNVEPPVAQAFRPGSGNVDPPGAQAFSPGSGYVDPPVAQAFRPAGEIAPVAQGFSPAPETAPTLHPAGGTTADRSTVHGPRSPVSAALAALNNYHRWTRFLPAGAALDKILEHSGYLVLAATTPGGVEAGDLLHAVDRVRQVVEEGGSLDDAADALEADSEFTNEIESLPLEPGRTDVVRLMNLHKAKGLEGNVVFLADPCGGVRPGRVDVHVRRTGDKAEGWFKVVKKFESGGERVIGEHADWEARQAAELPYLAAEETRLLYVAATRARELLVVSRQVGGNGKGSPAWGLLNGALTQAQELRVPAAAAVVPAVALDCSTRAQAEAHAARVAADARVNRPSWSITSVTAEAKHLSRAVAQDEPAAADDSTRVVAQNTASHRADAGMAWGTLIHGLLEHAMRHPHATREDLRRLAMWLTVEEPQLRVVLEEALDTVEGVSRAEFWREAKSGEHYEEAPFAVADGRVLSNGVIDLLFKSADGWQVRDYKTTVALEPGAHERQLEAYRSALRKLSCEPVEAAVVHVRAVESGTEG